MTTRPIVPTFCWYGIYTGQCDNIQKGCLLFCFLYPLDLVLVFLDPISETMVNSVEQDSIQILFGCRIRKFNQKGLIRNAASQKACTYRSLFCCMLRRLQA